MMEDGGLGQGGYRMEAVTDGSATGYWAQSESETSGRTLCYNNNASTIFTITPIAYSGASALLASAAAVVTAAMTLF